MKCAECEAAQTKKNIIYEDESVIAVLEDKPATAGHITVFSKEHFPIIENIPDQTFSHMFSVANKVATACFEVLGSQGTNLIIKNGIPAGQTSNHSKIHILPRADGDGLKLDWQPTKADEEELSTTELQIKSQLEQPEQPKPVEEKPPEQDEVIPEESYLAQQLERTP